MLFKRHTRSGKFRRRTKTHTIEPTNFVQKNIHYVDIIVIIKLFEVLSNLTYLLYYYDLFTFERNSFRFFKSWTFDAGLPDQVL